MSTRNTLISFVTGAVAGGAAALLLAPQRGEKTRRRIAEEADRLTHDVREGAKNATQQVTQTAETHKEAVKEAVHAAKETYRDELDRKGGTRVPVENPMASR